MKGAGAAVSRVRVVDCVIVNDEIDLLEQRLVYLAEHIDAFCIVESLQDYRGRTKPAYVHRSGVLRRFEHLDIRHVILSELSATTDEPRAAAWQREACQRHGFLEGLSGLAPTDVALLCDVDEFPSLSLVARLHGGLAEVARLKMSHRIRFANLEARRPWIHPIAAPISAVADPHHLRTRAPSPRDLILGDAGWHFSYVGPPSLAQGKFETYAHTEHDVSYLKGPFHARMCTVLGADPTSTRKVLRLQQVNQLPAALVHGYIGRYAIRRRGPIRLLVASIYTGVVSIFVGENWMLRRVADRARAVKRRLLGQTG